MEVWHIHDKKNNVGRAFAKPEHFCHKVILYYRGYRYFNSIWWSKPSDNLKKKRKG